MANNPKGYTAYVKRSKENIAAVICVLHDIGANVSAVAFYQFMSKGDAPPMPNDRPFNFSEELRCTGRASTALPSGNAHVEDFIKTKMIEAYGMGVTVKIKEIEPKG